jgi:ABC-type ATPase with predicted acetyltransferase domain
MVRLISLEKPKLPVVKMLCDKIIDPKLLQYPMIKMCWSKNSFNIIVGSMGQGKTSLITSLVKNVFNECFEDIYLFMPENSRASLKNDIFEKHLPKDHIFDNLTAENLEEICEEKLKENTKEGWNSLLIIDDFQSLLKDKDIHKILHKIITKNRHLRCTIFLLQQSFQALPTILRELTTNLITFNVGKSQLLKVFDETMPISKEEFQEINRMVFKDPHDYLVVNFKHKKLYKKFDEIILDDDDRYEDLAHDKI